MQKSMVRKGLVLGIIVLFVGASVVPGVSIKDRDIIYVDDDNTSGPWDGTLEHPYQYIQDGIDAVIEGGTVYVYNGTYYEHVTVNKTINLVGENRNTTIIDGGGSGTVVNITEDNVIVTKFTIQNQNSETGYGIHLISDYNTISSNNIINNWCGMSPYGGNNNISDNIISDNAGEGLYLWNSSNNNILNNAICNNAKNGIYLDAYGGTTTNNIVLGNDISSNDYNGIFLRYADNNTITENTLQNNPKGIWFSIHSGNICQNNVVYHNNFIDNAINAYDEGINTWYNSTLEEGNYYDDYTGEDNNSDGIGDIPYDIPGDSNQDLYPLMYPWGKMPPVANFSYEIDGATVTFDASSSYDRDGEIVDYAWDFGDGVEGAGIIIDHVYEESGTYNVTLTVIDNDGYEGQIIKQIEVEDGGYEFETILIIGRITNLNAEEDFITFEAVNILCITFFPFSFNPYTSGEEITILHDYLGVVGTRFIFALCGASI